jgi:hypothetical protein
MTFTLQQSRMAYKKLPPEVQDLIVGNETMDLIANALKEVVLNEEQANLADSQILYAMYCLQSLDDAIKNIAELSGKTVDDFSKLKSTLENDIFSKYKINIDDFIESNKSLEPQTSPEVTKTTVTQDLIEAKEIHPMIEEGEVVHDALMQHTTNNKQLTTEDGGSNASRNDLQLTTDNQQVPTNNTQPTTDNSQEMVGSIPMQPTTNDKQPKPNTYPGGIDPYREPLS